MIPIQFIANRGGKGQGASPRELKVRDALGLKMHFVLPTRKQRPFPRHYTIDLADPSRRVAIEIDGPSHRLLSVKRSDARKARWLRSNGWTLIRVSNRDVDLRFEKTIRRLRRYL